MTQSKALTPTSKSSVKGENLPLARDPVYARLLREIGGVRGLRELAMHSNRPEARKLLALIEDRSFSRYGGKKLAQLANLSYLDLIAMRNERALMLATSNMIVEHIGDILEGAAVDATPTEESCPKCEGEMIIVVDDVSQRCPKCRGKGTVRVAGDKDARKFVGEVAGLVKGGGPTFNVSAQAGVQNVNNPHGTFEDLMKKAGQAIVIEAERVDEP